MRAWICTLSIVACTSTSTSNVPSPPSSEGGPAVVDAPGESSAAAPKPAPEAARPGMGFKAPRFQVVRIANTTEVEVTLHKREDVRPWTGDVSYTAEPLTITGLSRAGRVRERNVLESGRAIDLNGDGDKRDTFAVQCDAGRLAIGDTLRLAAVMGDDTATRTYDYADGFMGAIGSGSGSAMLYLPCGDDGSMTLGLAPQPIEVRTIPGPALMVLAFGDPALPPTIAVDAIAREPSRDGLEAQRFDVAAFEQVSDAPRWYAIAGAMVQLDPSAAQQKIRVFVEGDVEEVTIAINEGRADVQRARTYVSNQTVGSR